MGHAGVVNFERQEVRFGVGRRCGDHILALAGADFHNERVVVAPMLCDEIAVERHAFAYVQQIASGDIEQIRVGIVVPCALQAVVKPSGASHEGEHFVQWVWMRGARISGGGVSHAGSRGGSHRVCHMFLGMVGAAWSNVARLAHGVAIHLGR